MHSYTKDEARRIVMECAKKYKENLLNKKYIIIYRDRQDNSIKFFEIYFGKENYQHLTGIELIDSNGKVRKHVAGLFFDKCLNNRLAKNEIQFKKDGTTILKLQALPVMMKIQSVTKITGGYNGNRPYLIADKVVGNVNFCLGLIQDSHNDYYVPASSLLEDIKKLTREQSQVLAIFSKECSDNVYKNVRHVTKGLNLNNLDMPLEINNMISLEKYVSKN